MIKHVLMNKVVVITGAGSGIGRALAVELDKYNCRLAISDINQKTLLETAELLKNKPFMQTLDVSDQKAFSIHADSILKEFKQVDVVINNAGADLSEYIQDVSLDDFNWLMGVNFWGVVYGTKAFLDHMIARKTGTIVNISSILGIVGTSAHGTYAASKFAVRGFTESLRTEMLQQNTGVNIISVHPGAIATNIVNNSRFYKDHTGHSNKNELAQEFDKLAGVSAEQAACHIINGIIRRTPRIIIGWDAWLIDKIQRWFPVGYIKILLYLGKLTSKNKQQKN